MGGETGGEWTCVYVRLSPFAVHLKLSTLLVNRLSPSRKSDLRNTSKRNEQVCAVNYLPVKSPVTHETGAWERGMNRDDTGAPVKETA